MALGICEWLKSLLKELKMENDRPMKLYCDNKATISIAHNLFQLNRMKHTKVDRHFIKEKMNNGLICILFV